MKLISVFCLLVFLFSCDIQHTENHDPLKKTKSINEVNLNAFTELKNDRALYPFGCGSEAMDQIKMLALTFRYYKEVDFNELRGLAVYAAEVFLNIINSNEQIRPFLGNYPFKPENIEISIYLQKPDGTEPDPGKLTIMSMSDGFLVYKIIDPATDKLTRVRKESFEEAQALLSFEPKLNAKKL